MILGEKLAAGDPTALASIGPQVTGMTHSSLEPTSPGLEVLCERWEGPVMAYPEAMRSDSASPGTRPVLPGTRSMLL